MAQYHHNPRGVYNHGIFASQILGYRLRKSEGQYIMEGPVYHTEHIEYNGTSGYNFKRDKQRGP